MARIIIIMGVSGCGKTTVGKSIATQLKLPFFDGDDFHPKANIEKMKQHIPLNDIDRKPWLEILASNIKYWSISDGAVLACSALKESYRKILATHINTIDWVFLTGKYKVIQQRLEQREQHFMKSTLLQSQFDTLEIPTYGFHICIEKEREEIVTEIIEKLHTNA
ncbi:gluconokinase [uncultured Kordia sp.]|uniref:gluconokinase n=1 Tax=uncultured Kordia sp. TaxID=507699 RepID=UPI002620AD46|nr:gluconokinase [uncultured Kordia sp.]